MDVERINPQDYVNQIEAYGQHSLVPFSFVMISKIMYNDRKNKNWYHTGYFRTCSVL